MAKRIVLFTFLLIGCSSFAQVYKKPVYPQNYFRWPTELNPDIVANMGELRNNHWHMGLDVRTNAQVNKRVFAAADGYIAFVGIAPLSWGRWIIINHPNGLSTLYGHLNDFAPALEEYVTQHQYKTESWETRLEIPAGRFPVKKGDFISYSGTTGGSQGPHVHWEFIDTKSDKRLNPTLFGMPIADNIPPTITRIAMYDRSNSVYYQTPEFFKLTKIGGIYSVPRDTIKTVLKNLSFAIQAYDTRNGTANQDGIYSARLFFDGTELSSFYIDSIDYDDTRYMNSHIDYKLKYNGGPYVQQLSNLPGDHGGIYYPKGNIGVIQLADTFAHNVKIIVSDANQNISTIIFTIKRTGDYPIAFQNYEWLPNKLNRIFKFDFEAYLPMYSLYDKMNTGYSRSLSSAPNSVSAIHKLGENYIPVQGNFEVRIKPDKTISFEDKNKVVIKRTSKNTTVKKAVWNGEWMTAQFRDFGTFEAFVDNVPPAINSLGSGEVVNLNKASRISFTPTDNFGIADFRAEVDGKWLRFTNDKGRTWVYNFDSKVQPGIHTLVVTVTDIAGNKTIRSWKFSRGVTYTPPPAEKTSGKEGEMDDEEPVAKPVAKNKSALITTKTQKAKAVKKESASKNVAAKNIHSKTHPTATNKTEVVKKETASAKTPAKHHDKKSKIKKEPTTNNKEATKTADEKKKEALKKQEAEKKAGIKKKK